MKSLPYWIQRADFTATDHEPVDVAHALRAFATHPWPEEQDLLSQLQNAGTPCCPPGIGFVDPGGQILHICPAIDGRALVHYHTTSVRKVLGLVPIAESVVHTKEDMSESDVRELIHFFFHGHHDSIFQRLTVD